LGSDPYECNLADGADDVKRNWGNFGEKKAASMKPPKIQGDCPKRDHSSPFDCRHISSRRVISSVFKARLCTLLRISLICLGVGPFVFFVFAHFTPPGSVDYQKYFFQSSAGLPTTVFSSCLTFPRFLLRLR